ncbi:MAG: hypothetical protein JWR13_230 [Mycobacterium sp.]|nr:hypothetical protein [Mycobacterium sp.]
MATLRSALNSSLAKRRSVTSRATTIHHTRLGPAAGAPLEPAHRAVGTDVSTLETDDRVARRKLTQDGFDRLTIPGVDVVDER